MEKTFVDCYFADGFVGGSWAYAVDTNNTEGTIVSGANNEMEQVEIQQLKDEERRLACYFLGWESIEVSRLPNRTAPSELLCHLYSQSSCLVQC